MAQDLPRQFGPYTLHQLIARGGMAEVYRATMPGIGGFEKPVAIKMILPHLAENEDFITMLIDEARIIVSVSHANIAQVYDLGRIEDNYYIAMEFIHGIDLAGMLKSLDERDVRIPIDHAVYITSCVCAGLHVAHSKSGADGQPLKIVHRDVSPHNVLLSYAGEVKIIDFGVAKAQNKEAHTKAGVIKGKLLYMAPEQAMAKDLDGRADLFAAGLILYRMLTGIVPFDGDNEFQIYNNLISKEVTPPRVLNSEVSEELSGIVMKMLERDPDHRFQDGYAVKSELERVLHGLAPGYTNSRLSRYIEKVFSNEEGDDESRTTVLESGPHDFGPGETPAFNSPGTGQVPAATDANDTVNAPTDLAEHERLRAQFRAQQGQGAQPQQRAPSGFQPLGGLGAPPQPGTAPQNAQQPMHQNAQQPMQRNQQSSGQHPGFSPAAGSSPRVNSPSSTMPPLPSTPQRASAPAMATGQFGASAAPMPKKKSKVLPLIGIILMLGIIGGLLAYGMTRTTSDVGATNTPDPEATVPEEIAEPVIADNVVVDDEPVEDDQPAPVESLAVPLGDPVSLRIDSEPRGAAIKIDGEELGTTPFSMTLDSTDEPMKIELALDNYDAHQLEVTPNKNIEHTIELESERKRRRPRRKTRPTTKSTSSDDLEIPILGASPKKKETKKVKPPKKTEKSSDIIDPFDL